MPKNPTRAQIEHRIAEARAVRDKAGVVLDESAISAASLQHWREHVDQVLATRVDPQERAVVRGCITRLVQRTPKLGVLGASEVLIKLGHLLALDDVAAGGGKPWPSKRSK